MPKKFFILLFFLLVFCGFLIAPFLAKDKKMLRKAQNVSTDQQVQSARDVLDIHQGTASVWMSFQPGFSGRRDHLIFQTDDSRLALFVDTYYSSGMERDIVRIGARAGGNRRFNDPGSNFPEASIIIDNTGALESYRHAWYSPVKFPEDEWHFIAMTWQGYPQGVVTIYFDGEMKGQKSYDQNYDDGRPLFEAYSVGYRPGAWVGEMKGGQDLRPATDMSLARGGIKIRDLRFKKRCLSAGEIKDMILESSTP